MYVHVTLVTQEMEGPVWILMSALLGTTPVLGLQMEPVPTPLEATTAHVTLVTQEMEGPVWTLMSAL